MINDRTGQDRTGHDRIRQDSTDRGVEFILMQILAFDLRIDYL